MPVGPTFQTARRGVRIRFAAVAAALLVATVTGVVAAARSSKWWSDNLGGPDSSAYADLDQIKKSNVQQLEVAWSYPVRVAGLQPDRGRRRDLHVGPQRLAHRA